MITIDDLFIELVGVFTAHSPKEDYNEQIEMVLKSAIVCFEKPANETDNEIFIGVNFTHWDKDFVKYYFKGTIKEFEAKMQGKMLEPVILQSQYKSK